MGDAVRQRRGGRTRVARRGIPRAGAGDRGGAPLASDARPLPPASLRRGGRRCARRRTLSDHGLRPRITLDAGGAVRMTGRSASDQFLEVFGVSSTLYRDLRSGALDFTEVFGREVKLGGSEVLLEALQLPGPRDRNDPRLLGEQPGERDPGGCRLLPLCDAAKHVHEAQIRLPGLRYEARNDVAEVGFVE